MRIGFITDKIYPYYVGGYETRFWELARRLASEHEVHVFTSCPEDACIQNITFHKIAPPMNYVDDRGFRVYSKNLLYTLLLAKKTLKKMDVIDCNTIPFLHLPMVKLLTKICGERYLATVHEALRNALTEYFTEYSKETNSLSQTLLRSNMPNVFFKESLKYPDKLLAVSKITKRVLEEQFGFNNVLYASNGITLQGERRGKKTTVPTVTYLGRLSPEKHLQDLIGALERLKKLGYSNLVCNIIGRGPEKEYLEKLAVQKKVQDLITFHGYVSEKEKTRILSETDVFALPSQREGFNIAALEAMSHGAPVVAANPPNYECAGVFEFLDNGYNGLVHRASDSEHLAKQVDTLLSNSKTWNMMSRNAIKTAERYSWDKIVVDYTKILEETLS